MADSHGSPSLTAPELGGNPSGPWWRGLNRTHRRVLVAALLGWALDGFETYALVIIIGPALADLLTADQQKNIALYAGLAIGITLLGSGVGGLIGGTIADYLGRKPVMLWSIAAYSILTGLTAFSSSIGMLIALRFLTGLALGSEWATGASLIQETWPERSRTKGAAIVQSGFGIGSLLAAVAWLIIASIDPTAWRAMFILGVLPALLVLFLRTRVPESERWQRAVGRTDAKKAKAKTSRGLTFTQIFAEPHTRKLVLLTFALSLVTIAGWYAISSFLPRFAVVLATKDGIANPASWAQLSVVTYTIGSIIGYVAAAFVADRFGRRFLIVLFLVGSAALTPITYLWPGNVQSFLIVAAINGMFTLGGFVWMPLYLPELFGTAVRSTAMSTVFNGTRLIAWVGPILTGSLVLVFGGIAPAAIWMGSVYVLGLIVVPFLKETRGLPLPE
ncbi:MFS transporter [Parafrigoribacterium mesophilum]|uniref:MFS transporter n=1 Tax=Parafrigoribacterium mesophilum TaxID=433646 RepID=UPI0031FD91CC